MIALSITVFFNSACNAQPDISKAKRLLGYEPTTQLKDGLQNFYDWFLRNKEVLLH